MSEAPARVLVFQPVFTQGAGLDFRLLGLQFWLADRLTSIGLEGASVLMRGPGGGEPELTATTAPGDEDIAATLAGSDARYGLVTIFAVLAGRPQLAVAKLAELRAGSGLHLLGRWTFADDEHLPGAALRVLIEAAGRMGYVIAPVGWERVFDTSEVAVAGNYLTALGALSVVEQGFVLEEDAAETSLRALISGVQVGMRPAVDLLPRLVLALHEHGRAPIEMLRAAATAARGLLPVEPESWAPMLRAVGLGGTLVN